MLTVRIGRYSYRILTVSATVLAIFGSPIIVTGLFLAAILVSAIELLAQLKIRYLTCIALLAVNAVLITASSCDLIATEPVMMMIIFGNYFLLSGSLTSIVNNRFNAVLLIGTTSLALLGLAAIEVTQLLLKSQPLNISLLQECIVLIAVQDFSASIGGKLYSYGRLAPRISPNKTLSGAAFGFIGGISCWFFLRAEVGSNFSGAVAVSVLIAGLFGDLVFSSVKRALLIKDFSSILGAKGGVLDRIDSTVIALIAAHALTM